MAVAAVIIAEAISIMFLAHLIKRILYAWRQFYTVRREQLQCLVKLVFCFR